MREREREIRHMCTCCYRKRSVLSEDTGKMLEPHISKKFGLSFVRINLWKIDFDKFQNHNFIELFCFHKLLESKKLFSMFS